MADTPLTMESLQETIKTLVEDEQTWVLDKLLLPIMDKYETVEELDEDIKAIDEEFEDGDGEDDPSKINEMMKTAKQYKNYVIVSCRKKRDEQFFFQFSNSNNLCQLDVVPCNFVDSLNQPPKSDEVVAVGMISKLAETLYN